MKFDFKIPIFLAFGGAFLWFGHEVCGVICILTAVILA